jgi:hypothetical protein
MVLGPSPIDELSPRLKKAVAEFNRSEHQRNQVLREWADLRQRLAQSPESLVLVRQFERKTAMLREVENGFNGAVARVRQLQNQIAVEFNRWSWNAREAASQAAAPKSV